MKAPRVVGRYELLLPLASGGMATVYLGRQRSQLGFQRTVAVKQLHQHYAEDPDLVAMLLDEARIVSRIRHANVVPTLDVVAEGGELLVVMEYVEGETLANLLRLAKAAGQAVSPAIILSIVVQLLAGLHAAHEATDAMGKPLQVVHRDVSPQNVIVGADGVARVLDFGIAKAMGRSQTTRDGQVKGKLRYMAPEQIRGRRDVDRRLDVYAAAVVAWESLAGARLVDGDEAAIFSQLFDDDRVVPSFESVGARALPAVEAELRRALAVSREERHSTAAELAAALVRVHPMATPSEVAAWVAALAGSRLRGREEKLRQAEAGVVEDPTTHDLQVKLVRPLPQEEATALTDAGGKTSQPAVVVVRLPRDRRVLLGLAGAIALATLVVGGAALRRATAGPSGEEVAVPAASGSSSPAEASPAASTRALPPTDGAGGATGTDGPAGTAGGGGGDVRKLPPRGPCEPPFVVVRGIKKYKRECLK